jgi:hypothetical protein
MWPAVPRPCHAVQADRRSRSSIRWRLPGERDPTAHLTSRINRLRYLTIHTIEAFSRRRGFAIDSIWVQVFDGAL